MEKVEIQAATSSPTTVKERTDIVVTPGECPTCVSGVDPTIGAGLFQDALLEGL
jgi:hypothetical protein